MEAVGNSLAVESLSMYLGAGESEAIVLAKEKDCPLIIDDGDGRKAASNMNMDITGTVGILSKVED